jgi:hypothetical protein
MFYEIAEQGPLKPWEIRRLRVFERSVRFDNLVVEVFDVATDILFMLVMFK